jgi:PAS domain S-box-containing protein
MTEKPTYDELAQKIRALEKELFEAKKINEVLVENEERVRVTLEQLNGILWAVDNELRFTMSKGRGLSTLGLLPDQVVGMSLYDYLKTNDHNHPTIANHHRVLRGERLRYETLRNDVIFSSVLSPLMNSKGEIVGVVGLALDITENKKAEDERKSLQKQLSNAMEIALLGHWEYDVASDFFTFNDHFYKMLRTSTQKIGGYTMSSADYAKRFVHPDDILVVAEEIRKAIETAEPNFRRKFEHRMIYADGALGYISVQFFTIKDSQGKTIRTYGVNQDITERKQAEEELSRIFELSPDLLGMANVNEGYFKRINPAWEIFGRPLEEFISRPFIDLIHPDDRNATTRQVESMQSGHYALGFENRYRCKDGSYRTIEWRATSAQADGTVYVAGRDVTERNISEARQRESEEKLRMALESAIADSWEMNLITGELSYSDQWTRHIGYEPGEVPYTIDGALKILHPDDIPDNQEALKAHLSGQKQNYETETRIRRKDGTYAWILSRGKVIERDKKGNPVRLIGTNIDITERKLAEAALREGRATLEAALESMTDAVFISDVDGKFIEFNEAFATYHRFKNKNECLKTLAEYPDVFDVYLPDGTLAPLEMWAVPRALKGETVKNAEYTIRRKDTGETWIGSYNFAPIRDKDDILSGSVVVGRDITEQKQIEARLRQSQKLESIGNLAGGIAHDFNNILASIIGFTELALDDVTKETEQADNLQEVYTAAKRARDLVKQILAFARQSDEERKPLKVGPIAKEVLKLIRSTIPTTIAIKENIASHSHIMGNPSQIHQLFMNLCTNAAQAMEDNGGILEIGVNDVAYSDHLPLSLSELKPGGYLKVTVADTGCGISADILASIFEPYFTTKGVGEGTGMGLALVHGIVESYGGKITVESEIGKGTLFSIYLPITKKSEDYQHYDQQNLPSGTEHILLVDDELPIVKIGSRILERLGYVVTTRTSSVEALEFFRSKPNEIDLVISDMAMPNMTGDILAVEMMKIRPDIPVILCTGYSKKISNESASGIGIKAFAYKPIVKADLAKTVRKVLDEVKSTLPR